MTRRLAAAGAVLATILAGGVLAADYPFSGSVTVTITTPPPAGPNTMTLTNQTGSAVTNYPLRFGRGFLPGAVAHFPQVLLNGAPTATQADVTNKWPDGSVKFAALSVLVPSIPVGSPVTVTFQDQATGNNAAMTTAQMVAMLTNDATIQVDAPAELAGSPPTPNSIAQWQAITNGSFCVTIDGTNRCPVINFAGVADAPAVATKIQAAIVALGSPVTAWSDYYHWTLQTNALGPGHSITAATAPSSGTDIRAALGWDTPQFRQPSGTATVGLKGMLNGGFCRVRLPGPIAQSISCADDTAGASFDVGFDGTHHPLRPRFYATFWPGISKVDTRFVGDGSKSTELTDQLYKATLSLGGAAVYTLDLTGTQATTAYLAGVKLTPAQLAETRAYLRQLLADPNWRGVEVIDDLRVGNGLTSRQAIEAWLTSATAAKKHWAVSSWVKEFWQGGAPPLQVDIDPNLVYLTSTRFIPNFDPAVPMQPANLASFYTSFIAGNNEPYDGGWNGGTYVNSMSQVGGRQELGPYPVSCGDWLYTGMWQMRDMCSRLADLAAAFPLNIRETAPGYRLSRLDTVGSNTGLGHEIAITDRPQISSATPYLLMGRPSGTSMLITIGPVDTNQPWTFNEAHLPAPHYVPYLLTGDPYYLDQLYNWAGFCALVADGQAGYYFGGRGPDGREGVINDETRGLGWGMRTRAEAAFIAPDADSEKPYLIYLTNDALARWEGTVNITGTPYQTGPVIVGSKAASSNTCPVDCNLWTWAKTVGNHEAPYMPSTSISPLHMWESYCNPTTTTPTNVCDASGYPGGTGSTFTSDVGSDDSPWMENYFRYGVLRARELGFAATPLATWLMVYNVGLALDAGPSLTTPTIPGAEMAALYRMPTALHSTGTWIQTWPDVLNHLWSDYRDGTPAGTAYPGGLPMYYQAQTGYNPKTGAVSIPPAPNSGASDYYGPTFIGVTCLGADLNPRGADACAWFHAHAPTPYANGPGGNDPRWSFITRTDPNVLPAIPAYPP